MMKWVSKMTLAQLIRVKQEDLSTQEAVDMNSTAAKRLGSRKRKQVVSDIKRHKEFGVEVEIGFQKIERLDNEL